MCVLGKGYTPAHCEEESHSNSDNQLLVEVADDDGETSTVAAVEEHRQPNHATIRAEANSSVVQVDEQLEESVLKPFKDEFNFRDAVEHLEDSKPLERSDDVDSKPVTHLGREEIVKIADPSSPPPAVVQLVTNDSISPARLSQLVKDRKQRLKTPLKTPISDVKRAVALSPLPPYASSSPYNALTTPNVTSGLVSASHLPLSALTSESCSPSHGSFPYATQSSGVVVPSLLLLSADVTALLNSFGDHIGAQLELFGNSALETASIVGHRLYNGMPHYNNSEMQELILLKHSLLNELSEVRMMLTVNSTGISGVRSAIDSMHSDGTCVDHRNQPSSSDAVVHSVDPLLSVEQVKSLTVLTPQVFIVFSYW